jgi:hypothetical protein
VQHGFVEGAIAESDAPRFNSNVWVISGMTRKRGRAGVQSTVAARNTLVEKIA